MDQTRISARLAFTLIELLLVVVIIGILAGGVAISLVGRSDEARHTRAKADMAAVLSLALDMFEQDVGRYPTTDEGLAVLVEDTANLPGWKRAYLQGGLKPDPWDTPYQYAYDPTNSRYTLTCAGPDQRIGTADDITETR